MQPKGPQNEAFGVVCLLAEIPVSLKNVLTNTFFVLTANTVRCSLCVSRQPIITVSAQPELITHMSTKESAAQEKANEKLLEARKKNLDLALTHIQKEFGETAIMRLGDAGCVDVDVIPTGNLLIDRALGVGGFPKGRIM